MTKYCRCINCRTTRNHTTDYRKHFGKSWQVDSFVQDMVTLDEKWYPCLKVREGFIKQHCITPEEAEMIRGYDKHSI